MKKQNAKKPYDSCPDGMTYLICPLNQDDIKNSIDEIYLVPNILVDTFSSTEICNWCKKNNNKTR